MDIPAEMAAIERRVKTAGFPVAELLRRANVDASQWVRWKGGKQSPMVATWSKIVAAVDNLAPADDQAAQQHVEGRRPPAKPGAVA